MLFVIYFQMQPQFKEDSAKAYREYLVKEKLKQPHEIDAEVEKHKKQVVTGIISMQIFGYLIIGAIVTAGCSALLTRRNQ